MLGVVQSPLLLHQLGAQVNERQEAVKHTLNKCNEHACISAGDTALRCLVDHLVQRLQRLCPSPSATKPVRRGAAPSPAVDCRADGRGSRICEAATLAVVLNEVIFGASDAWRMAGIEAWQLPEGHAGGMYTLPFQHASHSLLQSSMANAEHLKTSVHGLVQLV